jgi:hypothetical protein
MAKKKADGGTAITDAEARTLRPPSAVESRQDFKPDYDKSWAIVIGIDSYQNMQPLHHAVKDADGMARLLITELGFPKEQVLVVLDPPPGTSDAPYALFGTPASPASKDVIERLLFTELPNRAGRDDRVIICFAGHGERRPLPTGEEIGYLIPADALPGEWHTYILTESVTQAGNFCQAKHVFYLMDACYSGLAFGRDSVERTPFEKTMLTHRARMALTAGTAEQMVNDKGPGGHSPFTWYVLQGLQREAARPGSSVITGSDLMLYVRNQVGEHFGSQQTPDFGKLPGHESGGDFVFRLPAVRPTSPSTEQPRLDTATSPGKGMPRLLLAALGVIAVVLLGIIIVLLLRLTPSPKEAAMALAFLILLIVFPFLLVKVFRWPLYWLRELWMTRIRVMLRRPATCQAS